MTTYHMPVTAEQFSTDPAKKIPDGLEPVMVGRSGHTIMDHGHTDDPRYTRGYTLRVPNDYFIVQDGDWVVTSARGARALISDADFKALYRESPPT